MSHQTLVFFVHFWHDFNTRLVSWGQQRCQYSVEEVAKILKISSNVTSRYKLYLDNITNSRHGYRTTTNNSVNKANNNINNKCIWTSRNGLVDGKRKSESHQRNIMCNFMKYEIETAIYAKRKYWKCSVFVSQCLLSTNSHFFYRSNEFGFGCCMWNIENVFRCYLCFLQPMPIPFTSPPHPLVRNEWREHIENAGLNI